MSELATAVIHIPTDEKTLCFVGYWDSSRNRASVCMNTINCISTGIQSEYEHICNDNEPVLECKLKYTPLFNVNILESGVEVDAIMMKINKIHKINRITRTEIHIFVACAPSSLRNIDVRQYIDEQLMDHFNANTGSQSPSDSTDSKESKDQSQIVSDDSTDSKDQSQIVPGVSDDSDDPEDSDDFDDFDAKYGRLRDPVDPEDTNDQTQSDSEDSDVSDVSDDPEDPKDHEDQSLNDSEDCEDPEDPKDPSQSDSEDCEDPEDHEDQSLNDPEDCEDSNDQHSGDADESNVYTLIVEDLMLLESTRGYILCGDVAPGQCRTPCVKSDTTWICGCPIFLYQHDNIKDCALCGHNLGAHCTLPK